MLGFNNLQNARYMIARKNAEFRQISSDENFKFQAMKFQKLFMPELWTVLRTDGALVEKL